MQGRGLCPLHPHQGGKAPLEPQVISNKIAGRGRKRRSFPLSIEKGKNASSLNEPCVSQRLFFFIQAGCVFFRFIREMNPLALGTAKRFSCSEAAADNSRDRQIPIGTFQFSKKIATVKVGQVRRLAGPLNGEHKENSATKPFGVPFSAQPEGVNHRRIENSIKSPSEGI